MRFPEMDYTYATRLKKTFLLKLLLMLGLFAGLPGSLHAEIPEVSDEDITQVIERNLIFSDKVASHLIDVNTANGIVTLSGTVNNLLAKEHAATLAKAIKGVRSVVNEIVVIPLVYEDTAIKQNIEKALLANPATEAFEVDVRVDNGTVNLGGTVDSYGEKHLSGEVAKAVGGVVAVNNNITIVYKHERPVYEITNEIKEKLKFDPYIHADQITITYDEGTVTLSGVVSSSFIKNRVYFNAWVAGVNAVDHENLLVSEWGGAGMIRPPYIFRTDEELEKGLESALVMDSRVFSPNVNVDVDLKVATLTGAVATLGAKNAAEEDAMNTPGIYTVKNRLKVRPEEPLSDESIRVLVSAALERNPLLVRHDITVVVINKKVYLYGTVDSFYEKSQAYLAASNVKGVVAVENKLAVNVTYPPKDDADISRDIHDTYFWDVEIDERHLGVSVESGVAEIFGTVDAWSELDKAIDMAFQCGADTVVTKVKVTGGKSYDKVYQYADYYSQ